MQRVILLGASNLTVSFPLVLENLRAGRNGPLDVLAAHGHGRSYGIWSRVLARELPGIAECDLWRELDKRAEPGDHTRALLTDVGNDLLYGVPVETILEWVKTCLARLTQQRAQSVLTLLPLASVQRLSVWRYELTRTLFFPRSGVRMAPMLQRACELNERLRELGSSFGATIIDPPGDWYGFDPIHIRRSRRAEAWRAILSAWPSAPAATGWHALRDEGRGQVDHETDHALSGLATRPTGPVQSIRLWRLRPAERRIFGHRQTAPQPALEIDGTSISVY